MSLLLVAMPVYRDSLSYSSFVSSCIYVSCYGGALMILTKEKKKWRDLIKVRCVPCTNVHIRDPRVDGYSAATAVLVGSGFSARMVNSFIRSCDRPIANNLSEEEVTDMIARGDANYGRVPAGVDLERDFNDVRQGVIAKWSIQPPGKTDFVVSESELPY